MSVLDRVPMRKFLSGLGRGWARLGPAARQAGTEVPAPGGWSQARPDAARLPANLWIGALDRRLLVFARTHGHSPLADRVIASGSRLGEHAACWLILGAGGALLDGGDGRRHRWLRGMQVVAGSYVCNYALKVTVRRHRPELPGLPPLTSTVSQLSFPSAHATSSFAAARAYRGLAPAPALYGAALALAVSRPYLGVHYPTDVATGAALGTLIASRWRACR